jgi:serine/threonine-protein kinase
MLRDDSTESLGRPPPGSDPALATTQAAPASPPLREPERREIPQALRDRYRDVSLLGEGGMGTVFRAYDLRLGRAVALKLLKRTGPEELSRFLQEARAQARIQHENVCPVHDAGDAGGEPFIVMQLIEGEPLSRAKDRMSLEQKVMVMRKVAAAVHEAHRAGLIHRDIKPGNILVERADDGSFKPYVVDFGLAREVTAQGQTLTGAVLGTPAYMAPEQARGDVRALDRRTDVYSLGVTLYDLLADRTPFVEEQVWKLIVAVTTGDPPSLASVKKGVPEELETIVMKCLERDPARRYDSARALGEDLQRFLDGEPVHATRAGLAYVLWKKAKKHKLATSLVATTTAAVLTFSAVWVKARREAEAQARMGQEMGESVKEMELFLRSAYELPLHDVERERGVVRGRLTRIEERMRAAGKIADGPGHHALGRGYLALGDPSSAREHLERATAAGYSSPELSYSLAQALGELYRREMESTRRITNEEDRKRREAELARELRDPALTALRSVVGAQIEVPEHAEGLIAFYEGRYDDALAKARAASEKAPWMYEAKKLEADALFALGSRYRHDAAFDYERMMAYFEPAAKAYRVAAEIARSDPEVHRSECDLWMQAALSDRMKGQSAARSFDLSLAACDRAVSASSADPRALVQRALALRLRAEVGVGAGGEDTTAAAETALRAAEEAVRASPGDAMAQYALGGSAHLAADERFQRGFEASAERARAAFEEAIRIDPGFTWALDELGDVFTLTAMLGSWRGADPEPSLDAALRQYDRAIARDATFRAPVSKKALVQALLAEDLLSRGRSPEEPLSQLRKSAEALASEGGGSWLSAYWTARAHRLRARYEADSGGDPRPSVEAASSSLKGLGEEVKKDYWLSCEIAEIRLVEAEHAVAAGREPSDALREARDAARRAATAKPLYLDPRVLRARIEIVAIAWAIARRKVESSIFAAAMEPLLPLTNEERADPQLYEVMAEIHWLRAKSSAPGDPSLGGEIARGLSMADMALSRNPHMAAALAIR